MENNWLEKGLNDKVNEYEHDLSMDLEEAWKALEAQRRPEKKKRRPLGWWWFFGSLLLVSTSAYLLWNMTYSNSAAETLGGVVVEQTTTQDISESENIDSGNTYNDPPTGKAGDRLLNDNVLNNNSKFSKTKESTVLESSLDKSIKAKTTSLTKTKTSKRSSISSKGSNIQESNTNNQIASLDLNNSNQESQATAKSTDGEASVSKKEGKTILQLQSLKIFIENENANENPKTFDLPQKAKTPEEIPAYPYKKPRPALPQSVAASVGYGFLSKGKTLTEEVPLDVLSINLSYQKYVTKRLYFKTGVYVDQFTNKTEMSLTNSYTKFKEDQLVEINYYGDGSEDRIYGGADVGIEEKTDVQIFNKYTFVSLPLIAGVELTAFRKSSFQLEGGISTTLFSQYDRKYLPAANVETIEQLDNSDLKKSGVLNGLYALQWNYLPFKNNKNWELFLKYQGSFQLNELSKSQELNIQKFNTQQVFLGLQLHL